MCMYCYVTTKPIFILFSNKYKYRVFFCENYFYANCLFLNRIVIRQQCASHKKSLLLLVWLYNDFKYFFLCLPLHFVTSFLVQSSTLKVVFAKKCNLGNHFKIRNCISLSSSCCTIIITINEYYKYVRIYLLDKRQDVKIQMLDLIRWT